MHVREWTARRAGVAAGAGLGAVFASALALQASLIAESWGAGYWQVGCASGATVCVIALMRRRDRAWAAVAGLAVAAVAVVAARFVHLPAEPSPAMTLGLSVLVGSAVRALPTLPACAVAAGGLAVVVGGLLTAHTSSGVPPVTALNGAGWLAALVIGLCLRLLAARGLAAVKEVRRDERLRLARELHDVAAHHITGIVLQSQAARLLARKQPERLDDALEGIEAAGSDALAAMRRLVGLLRDADDAALATLGAERLSDLVERFDGPAVRLRLPGDEEESGWPPEVASTVHRIVQEALTNVSRHAPHARSVLVDVSRDRDAVVVEVVDDAPPVPLRRRLRGGYGLVGMRERLEALGGTLRAGPRPGAGWSVRATVPVPVRERR
ncbi:sensor histidine kinase [Streptosporangium carneum]|uniref:histidine kinase n=1 Tax=Streptosporangium carneum TaxID=47481 RepID=A0A9W6MFZ6_9ACTN|nr:histidine kinase [Streptosporangium carneum]GLK12627.1 two-component sensor histidine kinase [Streptosporangium carneum]